MNDGLFYFKEWLFTPPVFTLFFIWICCTLVGIYSGNAKPMIGAFGLTLIMFAFRMIPNLAL